MKRRIYLLLLLGLLLLATACGSGDVSEYEHGLISTTPTPTKVVTEAAEPSESPTEAPVESPVPTEVIVTEAPTGTPTATSSPTPTATSTPAPTATPTNKPTATPVPTKAPVVPNRTPGKAGQFKVVLDPGHGGPWPGAAAKTASGESLQESILSLKIANYCKAYLEKYYPEITVYMTRTDDSALNKDLAKDLKARVNVAVELKADAIVSLHLNAFDGSASGCLVCTPHRKQVKDQATALASAILDELEGLGIKSRNMSSGARSGVYYRKSENGTRDAQGNLVEYYAICRHAADNWLPGIIVEHCYIDSSTDQCFLDSEADLKALGEADARGIAAYFGLE